jgi:hypothetical protein
VLRGGTVAADSARWSKLRLSGFVVQILNPQLSIDSFHRAPMLKL